MTQFAVAETNHSALSTDEIVSK